MPGSLSFRQGMAANCSPPLCLKISAFSCAISSSVSRQSAEKPGRDHGDAAHAVLGQLLDGLVGVGLQPLVEAEARLEGQHQLRASRPMRLRKRLRGRDALRLIGIALVDVFLRHAVERGHDQFGLERQRLQMRVDRDRQRLDIIGIVVIRRRHPQGRLRAHLARARGTPRRTRSPRSPPNIADRAAPPAAGRSLARSGRRSASGSTDCRSASPNRPRHGRDRRCAAASFSDCARVMVLSGDSFFSVFQIFR